MSLLNFGFSRSKKNDDCEGVAKRFKISDDNDCGSTSTDSRPSPTPRPNTADQCEGQAAMNGKANH